VKYKRTKLATEEVSELDFHENHHKCFALHNIQKREVVKQIAEMLIETWNLGSAGNYTYELVEEAEDATQ
jgi:hypothetical protein